MTERTDPEPGADFLTVEQVGAMFHLSPASLYTMRRRGEAPGSLAVKVGRRLLWRRSDLDQWWDEQSKRGAK